MQPGDDIRLLLVDDDAQFLEMTTTYLQREFDMDTVSETDPRGALELVRGEEEIDCVVADYEMPGMGGLELLEEVRETHPRMPVMLFTGRGSEEVASEAFQRGATDYLQKDTSVEQFTVLANRVRNIVERRRNEQLRERQKQWHRALVEYVSDIVAVVGQDGRFTYQSPSVEHVLGYEPDELVGESAFDYFHPEDEAGVATFNQLIEEPDEIQRATFRFRDADGEWRHLEAVGNNQLDNPAVEGIVVSARDVTEQRERERQLRRQNERLEEFASVVSHDLRNPLSGARGYLALARQEEEGDPEYLEKIDRMHGRMEQLIDDLLALARQGEAVEAPEPVTLEAAVEDAWATVDARDADLQVAEDAHLRADPPRLVQLLENLFRNAVEHAGPDVAVTVGPLPDGDGFYVEDDGPGIEVDDPEEAFESGFSTAEDGTGFGLSIVAEIAKAHGWAVGVAEDAGGARFEVTGVDSLRPTARAS